MSGAMVHKDIPEPTAPGSWVDRFECSCGEHYDDFRGELSFDQAREAVKQHNDFEWYPSRGPVLWFMRVMKLELWYQQHFYCGGGG